MSKPTDRRTRRTKRVRYTYESDSELESQPASRAAPSRSSRRIQSYREDSDDEARDPAASSSFSSESEATPQPAISTNTSTRPNIRSTLNRKRTKPRRSARHNAQSFELFKRRKPNTLKQETQKVFAAPPPSGTIPLWQTLPYEILQAIFKYAAYPLYGKGSRATPSISWLCRTSGLSRSFHDASIAALLYAPPLYPSHLAQGLLELLKQDPEKLMINYRNKIKCLDVETKNLLVSKNGVDLEDMLSYTPLLEKLRIYHNYDDYESVVWARPSQAKGKRWSYPDSLFDKLDQQNVRLKAFEWNGRFPQSALVLASMLKFQSRQCFSTLEDLSILNLEVEEKDIETTNLASLVMSRMFDNLPKLMSLTFRNCNILSNTTVSYLPPSITHLSIRNCISLTSDVLSIYLASHGSSLTSLTLAGNQCMSLSFLAHLHDLCPHLQHLNIDLTYQDPSSYADTDPLFDEALADGPPTWPTSLSTLNITNLRQLDATEGADFLHSLASAAPGLAYLRTINIIAIIKGSWRDRAKLRQEWQPRLQDVFLDRSEPAKYVAPPMPKKAPTPRRPEKEAGRQSTRIQHLKNLSLSNSDSNDSDSAFSSSQQGVDRRTPGKRGHDGGDDRWFIQGRCNIVNLVVSDQRPAQEQYHENDFMDDEPSDDADWTGRDLEFN